VFNLIPSTYGALTNLNTNNVPWQINTPFTLGTALNKNQVAYNATGAITLYDEGSGQFVP